MRLLPCVLLLLPAAVVAQPSGPVSGRAKTATAVRAAAATRAAAALQGAATKGKPAAGGPLFITPEAALHHPVKVIAYGDMRFTDPAETTATNPAARRDLVARIAEEQPDAVLVSGDIPWRGNIVADYDEFRTETAAWRAEGLRVYPALGNHEFAHCDPPVCLEHWWNAFPEMPQLRGHRWYAAQLGDSIYMLALDSDTSLLPGSEQRAWLEAQIAQLPKTVKFVLITLHHPPVADIQTREHVDHNPRANEISLADLLRQRALTSAARFVVVAGHTHNYERFLEDGVMYFVSGGGGAQPYVVDRSPADLYQEKTFPNYHYIRFTLEGNKLKGEMVRLKDPAAKKPEWEVKDRFEIKAK